MNRYVSIYIFLVIFGLLGSLATKAFDLETLWVGRIVSLLTIGVACAAVVVPLATTKARIVGFLGVVFLGAASEVVGLYTGLPFGKYTYTTEWWPTVALPGGSAFPVALPFAWAMIAGPAYLIAVRLLKSPWSILVGGLLAAVVDIPMEPVMAGPLGYWIWVDSTWPIGGPLPGGAPVMNFIGWFLVSSGAGAILWIAGLRGEESARTPAIVLAAHTCFVLALGAILELPPRA